MLENLTLKTIGLAKQVGEYIQVELKSFDPSKIETKSKNSLVSHVDKTSEKKLVEGLRNILPEAGFITEEETVEQEDKEYKWIIDPLDGTTNFMHKIPVFAISIALMKGQELILGVIYEINQDEVFSAWKGGGAFLNGNSIAVSQSEQLEDTLIATGFPYYDYQRMSGYLGILEDLMKETRGIRRMGSAAVDLAYVACGRFDSFFEYSLNSWDVAAGILIVQEAGGLVNDFQSGSNYLFGKEILASNPNVHPLISKKIHQHFDKN